jgi:hypothetical protein
VAQAIASEIKLALRPREQARLLGLHPIDPVLTRLTSKALLLEQENRRGITEIEYFRQAIEKNPTFALAYTGLADSQILQDAGYGILPPYEARVEARTAALKAWKSTTHSPKLTPH